jgi:hypothetical protein
MKPRGLRRVVIGVAALVAALVAVLIAVNWDSVRDHIVVWHFQLTRDTEMFQPVSREADARRQISLEALLPIYAGELRCPVILDRLDLEGPSPFILRVTDSGRREIHVNRAWCCIQQRIPRRAVVVFRRNGVGREVQD